MFQVNGRLPGATTFSSQSCALHRPATCENKYGGRPVSRANPSDDRLEVLSQWAASPEAQSRALARLEKVLEPDDLLRANNPLAAAEAVANELQPHQ